MTVALNFETEAEVAACDKAIHAGAPSRNLDGGLILPAPDED